MKSGYPDSVNVPKGKGYALAEHLWATGYYSIPTDERTHGRPISLEKPTELELSSVEEHSLNIRKIGQNAVEKSQQ